MDKLKFQSQFHKELSELVHSHMVKRTPMDDILSALVDVNIRFFKSLICTSDIRNTVVMQVTEFIRKEVIKTEEKIH